MEEDAAGGHEGGFSWDVSAREYVKVYEAAAGGGTEKLTDSGSRLRTLSPEATHNGI